MCDPIIENSILIEKEPFRKEIVEEYMKKKDNFNKYLLRHYSQLEIDFDPNVIKILLQKLQVPIVDTVVTVFAGYTGEFACCLRKLGAKVIFTDPLEEWVRKAISLGFEAYKYAAEEIPKDIVKRTELFATFEGYIPFMGGSGSIYTTLRFLTAKYGILFAESKRTREELKAEGATAQLKYSFLPYSKVYSVKRMFRQRGELRIYHFCADELNKRKISLDCKVMKLLYDNFPNRKNSLNKGTLASFAKKVGIQKAQILASLKRILDLYQLHIPRSLKFAFPENSFAIFSKRFYLEL